MNSRLEDVKKSVRTKPLAEAVTLVQLIEQTELLEEISDKLGKRHTTFPLEWKNLAVDGTHELQNVEGEGGLHELLVLASSSDFSVIVYVDGRRAYEGSYSDYADKSLYVDEIVALQSGSNYRVHITDVPFSKSLRVLLVGSLTFSRVYLKYDVEAS